MEVTIDKRVDDVLPKGVANVDRVVWEIELAADAFGVGDGMDIAAGRLFFFVGEHLKGNANDIVAPTLK